MSSSGWRRGALAAALLAAGASLAVVAARGPARPTTMPEQVRAVASTLRCPVCQDLSVADSPSRLAEQFRQQIAQELEAGETPDQIRQGFVRAYGEWILLAPPRRGINLVAWVAPILLLLGGLALAWTAVRRWTSVRAPGPRAVPSRSVGDLSASDRRLLERALAAASEEPE